MVIIRRDRNPTYMEKNDENDEYDIIWWLVVGLCSFTASVYNRSPVIL